MIAGHIAAPRECRDISSRGALFHRIDPCLRHAIAPMVQCGMPQHSTSYVRLQWRTMSCIDARLIFFDMQSKIL